MGFCARVMLACLTPGAGFASSARLWEQTGKHSAHRFKIGVCDWTAGKRADPAALEVAKRLGLDGIMPLMEYSEAGSPLLRPAMQEQYRTMARELQMGIGG